MRRVAALRRENRRSGVAAVEAALVLPVFLTISLGIVEYGRAMMAGNLVTSAAREGARLAAKDGATNADVESAVTSFLASSLNVSASQVAVTITITAATGNPNPQNQCVAARTKDLVGVGVKVPYSAVAVIPGTFLKSVTLSAQSYMRHE